MKGLISKLIKEDNFLSLSGNLVIAVFGFGVFALLARSLDTDSFAQWVLFISGGSFIEMLRFGLTNNGLVRYLSGASEERGKQLIGSNVVISGAVTLCIALILITINHIFYKTISKSGYQLFFTWYPLIAFFNLPLNNALVILQAKMDYARILLIKALNSGLFFVTVLINTIALDLGIIELLGILMVINLFTSLYCILKGWDGIKYFQQANKETNKLLLNFGKFSVFTLVGSNLLKNADILIISISPLGSAAVALYSIPLKLLEVIQIPLRSFTATAFPRMSKASLTSDKAQLKFLFNTYSGALSYLFVAIALFFFLFAEQLAVVLSGQQYLNADAIGHDVVAIVKILSIYGILLPLDRMTGIALDSVNKPRINALKVGLMLVTNIVGDLVAVYVFKSLEWVANFTLIFTALGIVLGVVFLSKEFNLSATSLFKSANNFYLDLFEKLKSKNHTALS